MTIISYGIKKTKCQSCGEILRQERWNTRIDILYCENTRCLSFHQPQGTVRRFQSLDREVNKDGESYLDIDSGCTTATLYFGRQSSCSTCPLDQCTYDKKISSIERVKRDKEIAERLERGERVNVIAGELGLHPTTIHRIKRTLLK